MKGAGSRSGPEMFRFKKKLEMRVSSVGIMLYCLFVPELLAGVGTVDVGRLQMQGRMDYCIMERPKDR